jgi:DNA-binding transcriptional regulator YhcF (GntR family)
MSKKLLLREKQNSDQLHVVLREQLRTSLSRQPQGKRVDSERILAKEFGVSTTTVSRALQELQQEGILRRIPGKGTFLALPSVPEPGEHERQPAQHRLEERSAGQGLGGDDCSAASGSIGSARPGHRGAQEAALNAWIIVQLDLYEPTIDRSGEFWPQRIASRLEYLIDGQGGKTKITVGHTLSEEGCVQAFEAAREEGVNCVFFIVDERSPLVDGWVEQFVSAHIGADAEGASRAPSVVQISLAGLPQPYFDTVSFDGQWGSYLATAHLLRQGHRNIAFLAPSTRFAWLEPRIAGFHHALRGFGIEVPRGLGEFGVIRIPQGSDGTEMWRKHRVCTKSGRILLANSSLPRGYGPLLLMSLDGHRLLSYPIHYERAPGKPRGGSPTVSGRIWN